MKSFFKAMLECKGEIYARKDRKAADVFLEVDAFVRSGKYSSYKNASLLATLLLTETPAGIMEKQLGVNYNTIRVNTKTMSDSLYGIFGKEFFSELLADSQSDYIRHRMYNVKFYDVSARAFIPIEIITFSKEYSDMDANFTFSDCDREFDFLCRYSLQFMNKELDVLDKKKLAFLIDCINGKAGSVDDRAELLHGLKSYLS